MKKTKIFWYLLTLLPIILLVLWYFFPLQFFSNQELIRDFVNQFWIFSPLVFICIQILQVIITPFSHYVVSIAWWFIFWTFWGFIYNWIWRVIWTIIAFYLWRFFGRKILKHVVSPATIKKYDYYFNKGKILLFLAYFLPLFPDDELSYLAWMSKMNWKIFFIIMALWHIGWSLALSYTWNGIKSFKEPLFIIISLMTLLWGILFLIKYKKIQNKAIKES